MIEVVVVHRFTCPHCEKVIEVVKDVCNELGIPYRLVHVDEVGFYIATKMTNVKVIDLDTGKVREVKNLVKLSTATPMVIIRVFDEVGSRINYVLIGEVGREDLFNKFRENLHKLLYIAYQTVRTTLQDLGIR